MRIDILDVGKRFGEFVALDDKDCLQQRMVCIHTNALGPDDYTRWRTKARLVSTKKPYGSVVWSPFSNLWLYGATTDVLAARAAGMRLCLGAAGSHGRWWPEAWRS